MSQNQSTHQANSTNPLELPTRPTYFRDRSLEMEWLLAALRPGAVVTLCGPGGIGKTALAAEAVWRLTEDGSKIPESFPGGVIFHSFYKSPHADLALEHIASAYGQDPLPTPALAAHRALSNQCVLLVLDGAEAADDLPSVMQVRGCCTVLITSRDRAQMSGIGLDLKTLEDEAALGMLQDWSDGLIYDQDTARQVCRLLCGLPMALRLAGRYLAIHREDLKDFAAWLLENPLVALDHSDNRLESVPLMLERSTAALSPNARAALAASGLLAQAPFDRQMIAIALDCDNRRTGQALGELVRHSLLWRSGSAYQVSYSLVHTFAAERMKAPKGALDRLAAHLENMSHSKPGSNEFADLNQVRPHIIGVLNSLFKHGKLTSLLKLAWAVEDFLDLQCLWSERLKVCQIALAAAQKLGQRREQVVWLNNCGLTYRAMGQGQAAYKQFESALQISRQINDNLLEANILGNLGNLKRDMGQLDKAVEYYTATLEAARHSGDCNAQTAALGSLGNAYRSMKMMEIAVEFMSQALEIARQNQDLRSEGAILGNLGLVFDMLDEHQKAIEFYREALQIARQIGDRGGESLRLGKLGSAFHQAGENDAAIKHLELAAETAAEIGDHRAESKHLGELGAIYHRLGEDEQAVCCLEAALNAARLVGDRRAESQHLYHLSEALRYMGDDTGSQTMFLQYKMIEV